MWLCHDYVAFSHLNHSGATLLWAKEDATKRLYGGLHKTRGFYWIVMCGEVLRMAAVGDGNAKRFGSVPISKRSGRPR